MRANPDKNWRKRCRIDFLRPCIRAFFRRPFLHPPISPQRSGQLGRFFACLYIVYRQLIWHEDHNERCTIKFLQKCLPPPISTSLQTVNCCLLYLLCCIFTALFDPHNWRNLYTCCRILLGSLLITSVTSVPCFHCSDMYVPPGCRATQLPQYCTYLLTTQWAHVLRYILSNSAELAGPIIHVIYSLVCGHDLNYVFAYVTLITLTLQPWGFAIPLPITTCGWGQVYISSQICRNWSTSGPLDKQKSRVWCKRKMWTHAPS